MYYIRKHLPQMHVLPQAVDCAVGVFFRFYLLIITDFLFL
nr:MAG TPA: hypothetical protein [Caudoviricetes sp.]DAJ01574.1 MAG TPA: hypothetical protein [Caudoviricetes sp.]